MTSRGSEVRVVVVVNAVCLLSVVAATCAATRKLLSHEQKVAMVHAGFWSAAVFAVQMLWFSLVPRDLREEVPVIYAGLLWSVFVCALNVGQSDHRCEEHVRNAARSAMHWDSNAIIGLCFTVATLLADARVLSNRHLTIMLLSPILLCLCLIISMPFVDTTSLEGVVIRLLHKFAINASIGILGTGILLRMSHQSMMNLPPGAKG